MNSSKSSFKKRRIHELYSQTGQDQSNTLDENFECGSKDYESSLAYSDNQPNNGSNLNFLAHTDVSELNTSYTSESSFSSRVEDNEAEIFTDNNQYLIQNDDSIKASRTVWTSEEDEKLREAYKVYKGKAWKRVADFVGSKNSVQCNQRWDIIKPGIVKGQWTLDEDKLLIGLMSKGLPNWSHLAKNIPGRSAKQCRERWYYHLDPSISKAPFAKDEDDLLLKLYDEMGTKWAEIAKRIPGRSPNALKIRYNSIKRCISKGVPLDSIQHRRRSRLKIEN